MCSSDLGTSVLSAVPTKSVDGDLTTNGFTKVTMEQQNTTAGTDWTAAAAHFYNAAGSACEQASTATDSTNTVSKLIYCDAAKTSGGEMPLVWLDPLEAISDLRLIYLQGTGSASADPKTEVKPFATVKANTLYTVEFSLGKKTVTSPDIAPTIVKGDGCTHSWSSSSKAVSCVDTANSVTLHFLSWADRQVNAPALSTKSESGNVGTLDFKSAKDKAASNQIMTVMYDAQAGADATWAATAKNPKMAESACNAANPAGAVHCSNPTGTKGGTVVMTVKYIGMEKDDVETTPPYIAGLKAVAGLDLVGTGNAAKQQFTLQSTESVVHPAKLKVAPSTTAAPTTRLLAEGDKKSLGGFGTDDSWCKVLAASAPSAVFCVSDATTMTLSYLNTKTWGSEDIRTLTGLTTHAVTLDTSLTMTLTLTVASDKAANAMCASTEITSLNAASCAHAAVTVAAAGRRQLTSASVTIALGYIAAADLAAAETAFAAIEWSTNSDIVGTPTKTSAGGLGPGPAPTPETASPTPTSTTPSGAALRLVGVAFVAVFALV